MADEIRQKSDLAPGSERGEAFAGRRKVIKGLVSAVPVILTITNGEAAAAASIYQCVGTPEGANPEPCIPESIIPGVPIDTTYPDEWAREDTASTCRVETGPEFDGHKLLYADKEGNILGTDPGAGGYYLTNSCHQSFV